MTPGPGLHYSDSPACGMSIFMQTIPNLAFVCMWCSKKVNPHSKGQKTCGRFACSDKQCKYMAQFRSAIRNGIACAWRMAA